MIAPRHLPPNARVDDPISRLEKAIGDEVLSIVLASEAMSQIFDWIMRGYAPQRSLRLHLVVLCLFPQLLPCKRPSAAWCAQIHGVSREWARRLRRDFIDQFNGSLHFRNYHLSPKKRRIQGIEPYSMQAQEDSSL